MLKNCQISCLNFFFFLFVRICVPVLIAQKVKQRLNTRLPEATNTSIWLHCKGVNINVKDPRRTLTLTFKVPVLTIIEILLDNTKLL